MLAGDDARPASNLSVAHFEAADYEESIPAAAKAPDLLNIEDADAISKVRLRMCNAYLHR